MLRGLALTPACTSPTVGDESISKLKTHYKSRERGAAKTFLEAKGAVKTEAGSERYSHWVTPNGKVWVEYDDPPFYTLFLELPEPAWDA